MAKDHNYTMALHLFKDGKPICEENAITILGGWRDDDDEEANIASMVASLHDFVTKCFSINKLCSHGTPLVIDRRMLDAIGNGKAEITCQKCYYAKEVTVGCCVRDAAFPKRTDGMSELDYSKSIADFLVANIVPATGHCEHAK